MPAIGAAIAGLVGGTFAGSALGSLLVPKILGQLLRIVVFSALQSLAAPKPRAPGISTEYVSQGGVNPLSFIVGKYATAGNEVAPPMHHGKSGKTPNAYRTLVIALGDIAGQTISRIMVDGAYVTFSGTAHADYGTPATGRLAGYAWVKYYDGTQTVADPMLLAKYGSYPERPWSADMKLTGVCYAIMTFRLNRERMPAMPVCRFEMNGIKLYDPRFDTTVGGSGAQRWATPSTWAFTVNPIVITYNIMRGITIATLGVWGGDAVAADLPLSSWFAGMNLCDVSMPLAAGGSEPAFRAGYEITVDMEPASVVEELLKACTGQIAEVGGQWFVRVGGVGLPVLFITDADIIVTKAQDYDPFPSADQRMNGIDARYPEPDIGWEAKAAPARYNAAWEAEDGSKRRVAVVDLPACPYPNQVQRVMKAYIADERRFRSHRFVLPPDAAILSPLDGVSYISVANGYSAKVFDVSAVDDWQRSILQGVSMREADPTDYDWNTALELPYNNAAPTQVIVPTLYVETPNLIDNPKRDAAGANRGAGVKFTWAGAEQDGVSAIEYELRVTATAVLIKRGQTTDVESGQMPVYDGVLHGTGYQGRMRPVAIGPTDWTAWISVTTSAVNPVQSGDIDNNAILNQHTTLIPGNMISNPQFATGDARDWAPVAGPTLANQSVVPRATAGVPAGAPTANVMRYNFGVGAVTTISTGAGAIVYNQPNAVDCAIPVIAGQSYRFTIDAAKSAAGTLTSFVVGMTQLTSAGLFTNFAVEFVASVSTTFSTLTGIYVAPVGVVAVWPYVIGSMTGTGEVYWTNLTMRAMTSSSLVDVPSFSTAGLALFGGALQSTNFTAGVDGWQITNVGNAEFNSLVVRADMILLGAVSSNFGIRKAVSSVAVTSPTTATILGNTLTFAAGTFKQLVDSSNIAVTGSTFAANPIIMTGLIAVSGTSGTKARLELDLQYTIDGTSWFSLIPGFDVTLTAAQAGDGEQVAFTIVCEGSSGGSGSSSAALWTGLRLGAKTNNFTPFTGASINVGRIQSSIMQVNK